MKEELNKLLALIDSVQAVNTDKEIELLGSKESFNKLVEMGLDLNSIRHQEILIDRSNIYIIPVSPKPLKIYFESDKIYEVI